MSFKETITKTTNCSYFEGEIPVNYQYTFGIAGDKFFKTIKDKGDFIASKCSECGKLYIYPLIFCEECFSETSEYVSVGLEGELYSYTESYYDFQGTNYDKPHTIGLVKFRGVEGGIIHRINIDSSELCIGMSVAAKLKSPKERNGSIEDILYFEKV